LTVAERAQFNIQASLRRLRQRRPGRRNKVIATDARRLLRCSVPGRAIICSALDNLTKGASGQAVQNMNVMLGFPETLALEQVGLFP
jgi:N-acetyl-gamma-glutamylphosphate reductase